MIDPEEIKQVFFRCSNKDPNGFYADEVDIIEFGQKMGAFALSQKKPMDDGEITDFMLTVKPSENGDALFDRIKTVIRAVEKFHGIH